jgi:hypothetical protein
MAHLQALTTRRAGRSSTRAELIPEYGVFVAWQRPTDHVVSTQPVSDAMSVRPRPQAAQPTTPPTTGRRGRWFAVLALGLVVLAVWPLQVAIAAVLLGSAWLIDDSLRDVVPGHARNLRRALAPAPWVLAGFGVAATFVWPAATSSVALAFLLVAAVVYLCCETVALFRGP